MGWLGRNRNKDASPQQPVVNRSTNREYLEAILVQERTVAEITAKGEIFYVLRYYSASNTIFLVNKQGLVCNASPEQIDVNHPPRPVIINGLSNLDAVDLEVALEQINAYNLDIGDILTGIYSPGHSVSVHRAAAGVPYLTIYEQTLVPGLNCELAHDVGTLAAMVTKAKAQKELDAEAFLKAILWNTHPIARGDIIRFTHDGEDRGDRYMVSEVYDKPIMGGNGPIDFVAIRLFDQTTHTGLSYYALKVGHIDTWFQKDTERA